MAGFLQRILRFSAKAIRAGLTPSLVSYFFWIGCITSMFGAWSFISYEPIDGYLCAIPGEVNVTNGWTVGCGNCTDTLMLCDKSDCWRYAFNLSWQLDAATPNAPFYGDFQEAALDSTCNSLVLTADSPASMLTSIEDRRANPTKPQVSQSCVTWSCRVLVRAVMRSLGTQLTGPGNCTNAAPSIKPPWSESDCSCDDMTITMASATSFRAMCGAMSTGLQSAVFDRHVSTKDQCFQGSMTASSVLNPIEYGEFSLDVNCESIFENTQSTLGWFSVKNYLLANLADPTSFPIASYCRKVMCFAFVDTLSNPDCNFTTSVDLIASATTAGLIDAIATECQAEGLTLTPESMCAQPSLNESAYCTALFPGGRRLMSRVPQPLGDPKRLGAFWMEPILEASKARLPVETAEEVKPEHKPLGNATLTEVVVDFDGVEAVDGEEECGGNFCSFERRLQVTTAPTAAAATSTNLQEYTVTPWSTCACYMQCVPGVMTRSVSCPAGVTCQEPKPSSARSCVCKHCSDCDVLIFVLAAAAAYGATGLISFLLWLGFVAVAQLEEDDYTEMSCTLKLLGCFCKFLPIMTKIMTYATMLLVVVLVVTALVPLGEPYSDCKGSTAFTQLAIGGIVVWVVQLCVGVYMHRNKPMPPWLHTAQSSGAVKLLCKPLNAVGP